MLKRLSRLRVAVVLHLFHSLYALKLEEYLKGKVSKLLFIGHPPALKERGFPPAYRKYRRGEKVYECRPQQLQLPRIIKYVKDVFATLFLLLREVEKFDIYFSLNPWEFPLGLFLRKIGVVKKIIFHTGDYLPKNWFENPILDTIYQFMDKIAAEHADWVWNVSKVISIVRKWKGVNEAPAIEVPNGYDFEDVDRSPLEDINREHLAYFGFLSKNKGVQLAIESLPEIVKQFPNSKLIVIGSGPFEEELKERARKNGVADHVSFKGYVEKGKDVEAILTKCAVGIAPFRPVVNNFCLYGDPVKIRVYTACGLPVITTRVPKSAYDVDNNKAGMAIDYKKKEFIDAVSKLLKDDAIYEKYKSNAIEMASNHTWEEIYTNAFHNTPFFLPSKE